jgi:ATP-dependent Clp protease ATP-binding subunit ClpC
MFEKMTSQAQGAIVLAQEVARGLGHHHIGSEHLLLALVHRPSNSGPESVAGEALASAGVSTQLLRPRVLAVVGEGWSAPVGFIPFTPGARRVLEEAANESRRRGDQHIGTAHLLVSLLHEPNGVAARVLAETGVDLAVLEQRVVAARIHHRERLQMAGPSPPFNTQQLTSAALGVQRIVRAVASLQPLRSYHYLVALFDDSSSVAAKVLASFGLDREIVQQRITDMGTEGTTDALPQD